MTRLAEIEVHVNSMGELLDIVGAMRSLASMRMQETHRALPGIRRYAEAMAEAIGDALLLLPGGVAPERGGRQRRAMILCTAEHGFVGGFNERILDAAKPDPGDRDALFILGSRGAAMAHERGRPIVWTHPMATRLESVPETVRRLAAELYGRIAGGAITRVDLIFARYGQGSAMSIERRVLFPLDLAAFEAKSARPPPLHNLAPPVLIEKLIAEYIFALLTEAATESLAAENAARFNAMEAAHDNVSKKLDRLRADAREARQSEITTELIDLVTGAEALQSVEGRCSGLDGAESHDPAGCR